MSAFICTDKHISAIVSWASRNNVAACASGKEQEAADCLLAENIRSVNYRYQETTLIVPCEYTPDASRAPVEIIKLCHSLAYQSCEHREWETSEAKKIVDTIAAAATRALPGYAAAGWEA